MTSFCDVESALYNDFGIIRCQYCSGQVSLKRELEYKDTSLIININKVCQKKN
jgi:hypothetical protein